MNRGTNIPERSALAALVGARDWPALASALGWRGRRTRLSERARQTWGLPDDAPDAVHVLGAGEGWCLLCVGEDPGARERARVMRAVARAHADTMIWWWWEGDDELVVAMPDTNARDRPMSRELPVRIDAPAATSLELLATLHRDLVVRGPHPDLAEATRAHVRGCMRQDGLTRAFLGAFARAHATLIDTMSNGPSHERERHDVALVVLLRLVVLTFLQARGALDGDRHFLRRALERTRAAGGDFWVDVLAPLSFGALNTPEHERSARVRALGRFPFLNGGLFEPGPIERAHPELGWPPGVWDEVVGEVFERFPFALAQPCEDERWVIDPEALGKVFEGLMYGGTRRATGAFYTPREVVSGMVERALSHWLEGQCALTAERASALLRGRADGLTPEERLACADALSRVTILDPAVGTGAFLMGALAALRRAWRALRAAGIDGPDPDSYAGVRELVHRHLHGVDVNPTAARLCELRLWLELLSVAPEHAHELIDALEPLPNLSHRIASGDALVSATDVMKLGERGARFAYTARLRETLGEVRELERALLTSHGESKRGVGATLRERTARLERAMLEARRDVLERRRAPLEALAASHDLFGNTISLQEEQRKALKALQSELSNLADATRELDAGRSSGWRGAELAFSGALSAGGFDVIVTNPPWVRASHVAPGMRRVHAARFETARPNLWRSASSEGVRATFGAQADLAALFLERAIELTGPGSVIAALVPSKLLRGLHGAPARALLERHAILHVEDFSDATDEMFDATTYPASLLVRHEDTPHRGARRAPARTAPNTRVSVWRGRERAHWEVDQERLSSRVGERGAPWVLAPPSASSSLERMSACGEALGTRVDLRPRRGVLTGFNDAFVMSAAEARERGLEGSCRPVMGGRDVRAWRASTDRRILWMHDASGRAIEAPPAEVLAHLEPHRDRLDARADARSTTPHWSLFRTRSGLERPKVVWRDMGPCLQAAPVGAEVVPLNTLYYVPIDDAERAWALSAWLNSTPVRAWARAIAERARGGWRRHFAWVVSMLPAPTPLLDWLEGGVPDPTLAALMMCRTPSSTPDSRAIDDAIAFLYGLGRRDLVALGAEVTTRREEVQRWSA